MVDSSGWILIGNPVILQGEILKIFEKRQPK